MAFVDDPQILVDDPGVTVDGDFLMSIAQLLPAFTQGVTVENYRRVEAVTVRLGEIGFNPHNLRRRATR